MLDGCRLAAVNSRPGYGPGVYSHNFYDRGSASAGRPAQSYGNSFQGYRAPSAGSERGGYGQGSAYMGNGFMSSSVKRQHSGGFHLFGGGHEPKSFNESKAFKKEEKNFAKEERNFGGHSGGFHSSGGGHSSHGGHSGSHGGGHHRI
jgi:hypothetical protein